MAAAGGTMDDVVQITIRLKDYRDNAPGLNEHWSRVFPDETNQPTRLNGLPPNSGYLVQLELIAHLDD